MRSVRYAIDDLCKWIKQDGNLYEKLDKANKLKSMKLGSSYSPSPNYDMDSMSRERRDAQAWENYCIENKESTSIEYLNFSIDKTLVNFSYVIYLENVKSFNDAVGKNGVCEVYNIIETNKTKYDFTMFLESFAVSEATINNLNTTSTLYAKTQKAVDEYYYFNEIFEQKLVAYENTYKSFDFYNYNKHRMNLGNGVTYTDYLNTLSQSEKASISLMENFMYTTFLDLYEKVCELTV